MRERSEGQVQGAGSWWAHSASSVAFVWLIQLVRMLAPISLSFGASSRTYVLRAISAADAVYAGDGPMQRYRRLCVLHMTTTCGEAGETSASRDFPGPPELVQFDAVLLDTGGAPRVHASASS